MDKEDYLIFEHLFIQSSEVEPYTIVQKLNRGSSEVEPSTGGQSSEVEHLEPSLNFNHHSKPSLFKTCPAVPNVGGFKLNFVLSSQVIVRSPIG